MMPSMPRLSTPARSHSSAPSVPKISGVAIRSTADQKSTFANSATTSTLFIDRGTPWRPSSPPQPIPHEQRRDEHRHQRHGDDDVGNVRWYGDAAAHAVRADEHAGDEDCRDE